MRGNAEQLYWNGQVIGVITNSSVDMFDFYGAWKPTDDTELYQRFLTLVGEEGGARVAIGGPDSRLTGTVEIEPGAEIEIKLRPSS